MGLIKKVAKKINQEKGAVAVIVAFSLTALLGIAAIAVDAGSLFQERRDLQKAAEAAALAGVIELPETPDLAVSIAGDYADMNAPQTTGKQINVTSTYAYNDTIEVVLNNQDAPLYFARIWGKDKTPVAAEAVAVVSSPIAYGQGVIPFGIMAKDTTSTQPFGFVFGETVTLKQPSQQGEQGNF